MRTLSGFKGCTAELIQHSRACSLLVLTAVTRFVSLSLSLSLSPSLCAPLPLFPPPVVTVLGETRWKPSDSRIRIVSCVAQSKRYSGHLSFAYTSNETPSQPRATPGLHLCIGYFSTFEVLRRRSRRRVPRCGTSGQGDRPASTA